MVAPACPQCRSLSTYNITVMSDARWRFVCLRCGHKWEGEAIGGER